MAAQPIVSEGFRDPVRTWSSNVTGTMTVLQALRASPAAAAVIVTSDKVYRSPGAGRPYVEGDPLGGGDPYAASKAACEGLVSCWRDAFDDLPPMATARAGNVIGGGDFGSDRLIPDLVRAEVAGRPLALRNPAATRPFQHVLDVVAGYLILAEDLAEGRAPKPSISALPRPRSRFPTSCASGRRRRAARCRSRHPPSHCPRHRGLRSTAACARCLGLGTAVRHGGCRGRYRALV